MTASRNHFLSVLVLSLAGLLILCPAPVRAANGLFPKMPAGTNVFVLNCLDTDGDADDDEGGTDDEGLRMARALQGLVNQTGAEVYIVRGPQHMSQIEQCGRPFTILAMLPGKDSAVRTLFKKYQGRVKKMFLFDPRKDWSWYLALMGAAQQEGMPVTEEVLQSLTKEFHWKGGVEDFRSRWTNRVEAYDWALAHFMPACNKQVVFAPRLKHALFDYVVASKGFAFWLDFNSERAEVDKIFNTPGYGAGTSLMGYASTGDKGNDVSNPHGIGYVVGGHFANGSFWSSFPNQTFSQPPRQPAGKAIKALPGKIYISLRWSEGDNIAFNQNGVYQLWQDPKRGSFPMATALNSVLQELNPPLLEWYYSNMTTNDELVAGATGFQFINTWNYNADLFPAWCRLNREWSRDAGFGSAHIWMPVESSARFNTYMTNCGWLGVFGKGSLFKPGYPPMIPWERAVTENHLYDQLTKKLSPNPRAPVFFSLLLTTGRFRQAGGYAAVQRQLDRAQAAYPNRFVFMLPRDQFATFRAYHERAK